VEEERIFAQAFSMITGDYNSPRKKSKKAPNLLENYLQVQSISFSYLL